MDDLQKARADWLRELSRNIELESEVERLRCANFELQSRLLTAQLQSIINLMPRYA